MKRISVDVLAAALLVSCAGPYKVDQSIVAEMDSAARQAASKQPTAVREALLPPLRAEMPKVAGTPVEPRFDLVVNAAPAQQVFMSIVSGTRYSMVVNPGVGGRLSLNLKDVTVREALEAIREVYGYEFRVDGTRIYVEAAGMRMRVFQVNYLVGLRSGRSDVRVSSGAVSQSAAGQGMVAGAGQAGQGAGLPGQTINPIGLSAVNQATNDASRVSTISQSDFWNDLVVTLKALVGTAPGRKVIVNPQAGIVIVQAMPGEIRDVERYLKAMRLAVERQVMIEAKVVEVTLNRDYQAGVNWAAFSGRGLSVGQVSRGTLLQQSLPGGGSTPIAIGATSITGSAGAYTITGPAVGSFPGNDLINFTNPAASLFGLAFQTRNFASLITFLETQGAVQVLSSPRVAALNNQKAVLKVGTDQFFVTSITGTPIATVIGGPPNAVQVTPTFNSFFSGVSLDITPQIDEDGNILLHIHPLVSDVQNSPVAFNFGLGGSQDIPLAKSSINETDTMVRAQDGNIVALGGLMQVQVTNQNSGVPGLQDIPGIGAAFRSTTRTTVKKELVILLKPTVISSDYNWEGDIRESRERIRSYGGEMEPGSSDRSR
ncbi:MAG: pilus (MSHA type) biogenesis protein MshL [Betaproteobacteria bacterium]|nr:MAG: pilus (MSHA type) biogenesis protein MshL [Betaproteobacteria bacterium]